MTGVTIEGDYQGRRLAAWTSLLSGLEIVSVDGREVSRKRSFGLSTVHEVSVEGLDVDRVVVKVLPLRMELQKANAAVATFTHPRGMLIMAGAVLAGAATTILVMSLILR